MSGKLIVFGVSGETFDFPAYKTFSQGGQVFIQPVFDHRSHHFLDKVFNCPISVAKRASAVRSVNCCDKTR